MTLAAYHFPVPIRRVAPGQYEARCACGFVDARPSEESAEACWGAHLDALYVRRFVPAIATPNGNEKALSLDDAVHTPGARRTDPHTSHLADAEQKPEITRPIQALVLLALDGSTGLTDGDLLERIGGAESSPRKRRHELHVAGFVEPHGEAVTEFNRSTIVWRLTAQGQAYVSTHKTELHEAAAKRRKPR